MIYFIFTFILINVNAQNEFIRLKIFQIIPNDSIELSINHQCKIYYDTIHKYHISFSYYKDNKAINYDSVSYRIYIYNSGFNKYFDSHSFDITDLVKTAVKSTLEHYFVLLTVNKVYLKDTIIYNPKIEDEKYVISAKEEWCEFQTKEEAVAKVKYNKSFGMYSFDYDLKPAFIIKYKKKYK